MRKHFLLILLGLFFYTAGIGCTTAIISGKYTKDGRPLMWKVRDTDYARNSLMYYADGKYSYVGLINSEDTKGEQVWGGSNAAGFSIMNSASFNVNMDDTTSVKDREGYFMRKALQQCATLADFEALLTATSKPMGLAAHFGVIDAQGGAAFYEVNNYTFTKFDANNAAEAPNGYIIRTNFSFTGKKDIGYGFVRYQTAQELFYDAEGKGNINYKTLIQEFSRCLKNPILKRDYREEFSAIPAGENFVSADDLITRNETASVILVHGVKLGEAADLSTIWTIIGFPNTCVAMPVWLRGGSALPAMLVRDANGNSPLNRMALALSDECFPIRRSGGTRYMQISKLFNLEKTGYVQRIEVLENQLFKATDDKLDAWRKGNPKAAEIAAYYSWLDGLVAKTYTTEFGVKE